MIYNAPKVNHKFQWVPIVAKNKDWLVGYISGIQMIEALVIDTLKDNGVNINLRGIDLCLDSSRFNDVLENGKRESECSHDEIKKYWNEIVDKKISMVKEYHPDNDDSVFSDCFLEVECVCGLGIYTFKNEDEIPDKPLKCQICGKVIIDYTNHDDDEFDYDGESTSKFNKIVEEINNKIDEKLNGDKED